ncbi:energy transducer TonB [Lysobacter silvisoli]|uniref:TonB family protein n=1 Tax=Lysobacter silvisoli TaxID=2293254 RepID=A0A371JZG2_9GAMM|nr:TonB family protein [Lysobacter silvisoli]RDZ27068.1 TonB family protein [Lysobacter silvisoli]
MAEAGLRLTAAGWLACLGMQAAMMIGAAMLSPRNHDRAAVAGRPGRNRGLGAALCLTWLLATTAAWAQEGAPTRPPMVQVVREPMPPDAPLPPAPPSPNAATPAIAFADDGELYVCGRGSAVHYAAEYRAFEARHRPRGVDESKQYVAARESHIPTPEVPPERLRPGYVMLRVAVTAEGKVGDVLVACSTDVYFNDAAAAAVRSATFVPATSRGVAVASVESVEYWYPRF